MCPSSAANLNAQLRDSHPYPIDFSRVLNHALLKPKATIYTRRLSEATQKSLLPPELWADIFLYCLPEPPHPPETTSSSSTPIQIPWYFRDLYVTPLTAPLLLCRICRSWRQIALNLPRLWSRLVVFISLGRASPSIDLARLWLSRSGTLPLSLSLYQDNESNASRRATGRLLGLFVHHTSRWMNVHFHISGPRLGLSFISDEPTAPLLRRFVLYTHSRVYEQEEKYIFGIFKDVSRLSHLHVSRIPDLDMLGQSALVTVPWSQLEALSLDHVPSVGTWLCILKNCVNLCKGRATVASLFGPIEDEPLVHPVLTSLSISISKEHFAGFVARVALPRLQYLSVRICVDMQEDEDHRWPHREFEAFLERSAPSSTSRVLTRLELLNSGMQVEQFVRTILASPYLQGLEQLVLVNDRRMTEQWNQQAMWNSRPGSFMTDIAVELLKYPRLRDAHSATILFDQPGGSQGLTVAPTPADPAGATTTPVSSVSSINDTGDTDAEASLETWDANNVSCFLPRLTKLVVQGSDLLHTSDGVVSDMVASRYRHDATIAGASTSTATTTHPTADVAQLKSVALDIPSGNLMDLQRLRALQARGLDLVLGFIE
ncbi:hypothetical protein BKA70DRAFT_1143271 [Coprinopsis sp. MPI-PUGE-AT-0042]|nr:hypothetical protein BKA70DRAFT_1143271 [Coprinopsis sp. MPI-PUGE-AT-0042]